MRTTYRKRKNIKRVLLFILIGVLAFTSIFGVAALSQKLKKDEKTIYPAFSVGGLTTDGEYLDTNASIFTKKAFECNGLEVKLDFDAKIKYQIFYYDDLDTFISSSEEYTSSTKADIPEDATHARLVVVPVWNKDVELEDRVCHWYDITKYSSQLEISVLKESDEPVNIVELLELSSANSNSMISSNKVSLAGVGTIKCYGPNGGMLSISFYDSEDNFLDDESITFTKDLNSFVLDTIPENAFSVDFGFTLPMGTYIDDFEIYFDYNT